MANFSISATTLTFPDGTTQTTAAQSIPSTTKTVFLQAAAPTGWTQCVTNTCFSIRIVNTTGGGTGGTVNFTTAFASQAVAGTVSGGAVAATTLTTCQIPSHTHTYTRYNTLGSFSGGCTTSLWLNTSSQATGALGGSLSHTHTFTQPTFSGTAINLAVKYINAIVASKN
jgi:hypothetical protein